MEEWIGLLISSVGLFGGAPCAFLALMLRKTRRDAERKRNERIQLELQRQEGEERLSEVVLALVRLCDGTKDPLLAEALRAYAEHLEQTRALRNRILSMHTVK